MSRSRTLRARVDMLCELREQWVSLCTRRAEEGQVRVVKECRVGRAARAEGAHNVGVTRK